MHSSRNPPVDHSGSGWCGTRGPGDGFANIRIQMTKFSDLKLDPKVLSPSKTPAMNHPHLFRKARSHRRLKAATYWALPRPAPEKPRASFLPMISMLARGRARARMPRSLVLCPDAGTGRTSGREFRHLRQERQADQGAADWRRFVQGTGHFDRQRRRCSDRHSGPSCWTILSAAN